MVGLQKYKAKLGEDSKSVKAITRDDMEALYQAIVADPRLTVAQMRQGVVRYVSPFDIFTCSGQAELQLQCAYLIAFLMMLRIEEVVALRFENIDHPTDQPEYFGISLNPRKAAQTGVRNTWRLWANDGSPFLCPKRAMIMLAMIYGKSVHRSGPLFREVDSTGAVLPNSPIVRVWLIQKVFFYTQLTL